MEIKTTISFCCYLIVAFVFFAIGIKYFFSSRIMSYHQQAMEMKWEDMNHGMQVMSRVLMRGCGLGLITVSTIVIILLFLPFMKGEPWSKWTLGGITFIPVIIVLHLVYTIKKKTEGRPPLWAVAVMSVINFIAFILSL